MHILLTGTSSCCGLLISDCTPLAGFRRSDVVVANKLACLLFPLLCRPCRQESVDAACKLVQAAVGDQGLQLLMNNAGIGMVAPVEFFDLKAFR